MRRLREAEPALVVVEATGGMEIPATVLLAQAQLPVAIVNPRQVREFARATGKLAKTDRLDALVLAHFAYAIRPEPRPLPDEDLQALRALMARRQQPVQMRVAEQNRLRTVPKSMHPSLHAHIKWLDEEIHDGIQNSPSGECKRNSSRMCLVSGLPSPILSPLSSLSWAHCPSSKAKKVAIVACMHKLLTILNVIAKNGSYNSPQAGECRNSRIAPKMTRTAPIVKDRPVRPSHNHPVR